MNHLITQYPVTRTYLDRVSELAGGAVTPVVVSTITASGYGVVYRYFRALETDTIYVPVPDSAGRPLLSPLQVLAMLAGARRRLVIAPDFTVTSFGVADAVLGAARMAFGGLHGALTMIRDRWRLGRLLRAKRIRVPQDHARRAVYLKTNLWLGIQAGGSVTHTAGVLRGLLNKGFEVDFASVETPVVVPDNEALRFITVSPRSTYVVPRELNHYRHNARFVDDVRRRHPEFDGVIYQRLSLGNYAGVELSRRYRAPLVIEYNGSESWLARNWGTPLNFEELASRAEDACLRHAHLVVTVSDVLRDELIERGVEPARIVTHPNGVDADAFDPDIFSREDRRQLRARYGIPADALVATFVGTFGPWNGAEVLADCVARIAATDASPLERHKLHFLFIGDGVRRPTVEALTADTVARRHVTITGLVDQDEVALHLAASDILISPHVPNPDGSPFFGSPTKLFEYLASGRPVIGSDLGQIADVLEGCPKARDLASVDGGDPSGALGIVFTPEDVGELANAIRFLAENPEWRKQAGRNARKRALERHTWDRHVAAIMDGLARAQAIDAAEAAAPIRLLFNGLHSKSGGGLTYLKNVLPQFAGDGGADIHVCVHRDQAADLPDVGGKVTVHYLDFPQGFWRLQVREQIDVPRLAKTIGADATFSPANYGPLMAPNAVILLRNALSVAFIERRPLKLAYWALVYLGTVLSMVTAVRVITVSDYARRAASGGLMGLLADRVTVIPHGVSGVFSPPKANARRESFLLAVSDLYVQKNLDTLIRAMGRLGPGHSTVTLKIAGHTVDEEYFATLKRILSELELDGRVEFLGGVPTEDLVALYRRCAVFVFPSTVETFGNPLVEAMACGAPIACSNSAAMPEVVGEAAVFFDPTDVDSMAAAIDRLLKDTELRRRLSRIATERAKAFTWNETAERTLAVIREAATG